MSEAAAMTMLRADMHVHTCYSRHNDNIAFLGARDCYSRLKRSTRRPRRAAWTWSPLPTTTPSTARSRWVERMPDARDIIVGEEVSCWFPDGGPGPPGGVRDDRGAPSRAPAAAAKRIRPRRAPAAARVFFAFNHLLHFYRPAAAARRLSAAARSRAGDRGQKRDHGPRTTG